MTDMIVDPRLVCAEQRAAELLTTLQSAVNGDPHWRRNATQLLHYINTTDVKEQVAARLREIDALKRAAEILEDVCNGT